MNLDRLEGIEIREDGEHFRLEGIINLGKVLLGKYETRAESEEELNQLIHCHDIGVKVFEFQQDKGVPFE